MTPRRISWLAVGLLAVVAAAGCGGDTSSRAAAWEVSEDLDRSLSTVPIRFEHNPSCERFERLDVEEHPDRVEIAVRLVVEEPDEGESCPEMLESSVAEVSLDEPLGERELSGPGLQTVTPTNADSSALFGGLVRWASTAYA